MGALAPVTPWNHEDDFLLKNAVEAGASLESLAKGAVQFSRRYTFRELQVRWHSLLYNPVISVEASARMIELERPASSLPSKSNRTDISKENKCLLRKRKPESVRRCYAARKRTCPEPLSGDLSFFVQPGGFVNEGEAPGTNMLGHRIENHLGLEDANFDDLQHAFPQVTRNGGPTCTVSDFPMGQQNMLEDPIEQNTVHKEIPHMPGNNMAQAGNSTGMLKELECGGNYEANGIEANPEGTGKTIVCSGFGGNTIFNSPISNCGASSYHLQYTSSPHAMANWKPIGGLTLPEVPDDVRVGGNNEQGGDLFGIPDDGCAGKSTSDYDVIALEAKFNNHMSCDDLKNSTDCAEEFFDELSGGILEFLPSDEEPNEKKVEKDISVAADEFYETLQGLLISPDDANADSMPCILEKPESAAPDVYHDTSSRGPEQKDNAGENLGNSDLPSNPDTEMPASVSTLVSQLPEYRDGVICCTLNTEDPEIPCNDDVVFPSKPRAAPANRRSLNEANNLVFPGKDSTAIQAGEKTGSTMKRDSKRFGEIHPDSRTRGPEVGLKNTCEEFGVKFEASRGELLMGSRNPSASYGVPCQNGDGVKKELPEPGCVAEKPDHASNLGCLQVGAVGSNQDGLAPVCNRNQEFYELVSADPMAIEPGGEPLSSDPEEQFSESDSEIPYFSDIESMILEMDLGPDDQDSFLHREVAKYQHEDAKRAIIRLEQSAHSYMQRAIRSHGAFAILYGRHSKHYIKKPEVLLGRATDDVFVDIDLGREGRANKISRRQAIIKMDGDGTFSLKNVGKLAVYVNNQEILSGQCSSLHSNCLIEIREMPFIFETNEECVKNYLDKAAQRI